MKNNTHPQPARDAHATTAGAHISPNSKDPIQICNRAPVSASLMPHPNPFPHTHPSLTFPSQAPVMVHRLGRDALRSETRRRNNNDLSPNSETPAVCCTWATCSCLATTPRVTTLRWAKQNLSRGNGEGRWRWGSGVCGKQAGGGSCVAMAGPGLAWPAMVWQSQQKTPPPCPQPTSPLILPNLIKGSTPPPDCYPSSPSSLRGVDPRWKSPLTPSSDGVRCCTFVPQWELRRRGRYPVTALTCVPRATGTSPCLPSLSITLTNGRAKEGTHDPCLGNVNVKPFPKCCCCCLAILFENPFPVCIVSIILYY